MFDSIRRIADALQKVAENHELVAQNHDVGVKSLVSIAKSAQAHDSHHIEMHQKTMVIQDLLDLLKRIEIGSYHAATCAKVRVVMEPGDRVRLEFTPMPCTCGLDELHAEIDKKLAHEAHAH